MNRELFSPSEIRARSAMFRRAAVGLSDRVIADLRAEEMRRIEQYRMTLPDHRRHVFDGLSHADQVRCMTPLPRERSDDQKDLDEYREEMGMRP